MATSGYIPEKVHKLTAKQKVFISEYLKDSNGQRAATVAGYSNPNVSACQLLDPEKSPLVAAKIRAIRADQEMRCIKKSDDILKHIHTAIFFSPMRFFEPGGEGGWLLREDQYQNLPDDIAALIEEVEKREKVIEVEDSTGKKTKTTLVKFWVRLVSKTKMIELAAKHQLGDKLSVQVQTLDWNELAKQAGLGSGPVADRVAERVQQALEGRQPRQLLQEFGDGGISGPAPTTNGISNGENH